MQTPIEKAFESFGGQAKLGRALKRSRGAVNQWKVKKVPAELCPEIERLTGIRCEELRPDVSWGILRDRVNKDTA